jgi:molybdopterin converting factor small subunit
METQQTTIEVDKATRKELNKLKYVLDTKNVNETIMRLISLAKQIKTYPEMDEEYNNYVKGENNETKPNN